MKKGFKTFLDYLKIFLLAAVIVVPIRYFLFQPFLVQGASMVPNFETNDYLFIDEISYRFRAPQRGEVIVFIPPISSPKPFIKRIIGLPGEGVEIKDGKVYIIKNNKESLLDESNYLPKTVKTTGNLKIFLKKDEYFVLGDNRLNSADSRVFGPIKRSDIVGRAVLRLFPFSKTGPILRPAY